jgi:hypothetical protein
MSAQSTFATTADAEASRPTKDLYASTAKKSDIALEPESALLTHQSRQQFRLLPSNASTTKIVIHLRLAKEALTTTMKTNVS